MGNVLEGYGDGIGRTASGGCTEGYAGGLWMDNAGVQRFRNTLYGPDGFEGCGIYRRGCWGWGQRIEGFYDDGMGNGLWGVGEVFAMEDRGMHGRRMDR